MVEPCLEQGKARYECCLNKATRKQSQKWAGEVCSFKALKCSFEHIELHQTLGSELSARSSTLPRILFETFELWYDIIRAYYSLFYCYVYCWLLSYIL